jgi:hypothetical protein
LVRRIQSAAELELGETLLRGIEKHGADVNDRLARWVVWLAAVSVVFCRMGHVQCYCGDVFDWRCFVFFRFVKRLLRYM